MDKTIQILIGEINPQKFADNYRPNLETYNVEVDVEGNVVSLSGRHKDIRDALQYLDHENITYETNQ